MFLIILLFSVVFDGDFLLSEFWFGRTIGWWFAVIGLSPSTYSYTHASGALLAVSHTLIPAEDEAFEPEQKLSDMRKHGSFFDSYGGRAAEDATFKLVSSYFNFKAVCFFGILMWLTSACDDQSIAEYFVHTLRPYVPSAPLRRQYRVILCAECGDRPRLTTILLLFLILSDRRRLFSCRFQVLTGRVRGVLGIVCLLCMHLFHVKTGAHILPLCTTCSLRWQDRATTRPPCRSSTSLFVVHSAHLVPTSFRRTSKVGSHQQNCKNPSPWQAPFIPRKRLVFLMSHRMTLQKNETDPRST